MKFDLAVDRIVTGPFQENTFLVRDVFSQKALIIDPVSNTHLRAHETPAQLV